VARGHGEAVGLVLLLNAGALPITTSGKLQRALARKRWLGATLDTFASFAPPVTPAALSPQRP
jgi:hypothetical protein